MFCRQTGADPDQPEELKQLSERMKWPGVPVHVARLPRAAAVSTDAGGGARERPSCRGARAFIRKDGLLTNGAAAMGREPDLSRASRRRLRTAERVTEPQSFQEKPIFRTWCQEKGSRE